MEDILNIKEPIVNVNGIDQYEYFEYQPITGTNLNNFGGNITIQIETQDVFTHPSESYLEIIGRLVQNDGTRYGAATEITITNNGLLHLFKNIKYELSGQAIETITYPGQATTMLGLLKYPDDFYKSQGLNQLWYKDTNDAIVGNNGFTIRRNYIFSSNPVGDFSFRIPLKHIFGFCEDYDKVLYGMKQTITLTRNNDNDAIFKRGMIVGGGVGGGDAPAVAAGKVELSSISWFVPHVMPSDEPKMELYKFIEKKEKFPVGYRMIQCDSFSVPQSRSFTWRLSVKSSPEVPRFIIIGFQTGKNNDQEQNPSIFDNLNISSIYAMLNSRRYPAADYKISFPANKISRVYGDVALFRSKFGHLNELVSNPGITPSDYKALFPLFLFDVSKQSEKLKYSVTDIQIKAEFHAAVPVNTEAFAVIISDRLISFQSDGNKMSVVF